MPPSKVKNSGHKARRGAENCHLEPAGAIPQSRLDVRLHDRPHRRWAAFRILNIVDEYTRRSVRSPTWPATSAPGGSSRCWSGCSPSRPTEVPAIGQRPRVHRRRAGSVADRPGRNRGVRGEGQSQQNGFIERFNGTMRRECLNAEEFHRPTRSQVVIGDWVDGVQHHPPPSGAGHENPIGVRGRG